ncbi:sigma-70 family RNA polymerase sigma factor [Echinicola sp. CAU 1574]|uniref:Sigma-70 family RNA polymerase sigma factor n=1 Tax=Echinicola arenosa TaxID=2774144 RepID=A0ABR9AN36_9BACT|nr:sigma-70 family RNA polymerase sigma factor [Echinicola arenosa]MBD8489752.1 sigma-70 family RNA polymerase sigma factor [Echinicola arenosa]
MKDQLTSPAGREQFFLRLYQESFPDLAKYIQKRGGTLADAKDVFQDSLVIYYEQLTKEKPIANQKQQAYLFGIARHLWFKRYQQQSRFLNEVDGVGEGLISDQIPQEPAHRDVWQFLEQAGQKCMEMLKAFYYDRLSMEQLAGQFGYQSTRSATVQKYKCLEKVRDQVKQKSLTHEDFIG